MKIERQKVGTVEVLTPIGALVDEDSTRFRKLLIESLESASPRVVVCMQEVPYLDSLALEGLLEASEKLADRAMSLKLADVAPTCREVLELTGVADRLRFFEGVQDAVKSYL